jgi:hypothetical protein
MADEQLWADPTFPVPQVYNDSKHEYKDILFYLMMGMESVPETLNFLNHLIQLVARENLIKSCRRESFKS